MPPSQLKQLKASLKENGILGPQKSKKQRKTASKDVNERIKRNAALQDIRERFNPFEVKSPARKDKFDVVSTRKNKDGPGRPGVTKGLGEERRKATLLREIQSRNKIGGVVDRRFGEYDSSMTPEQRAAERFARQNLRKSQRTNMFNLEDDDEAEVELTHAGQTLSFGKESEADDFQEDIPVSPDGLPDDIDDDIDDRPRKRLRLDEGGSDVDRPDNAPDRRRSKREVMEEVMAKSKLYKHERQKLKEDDDQLRARLDEDMADIYSALREQPPVVRNDEIGASDKSISEPSMNPERAAMLAGRDRMEVEKEYEQRVREMHLDRRAKPSERTKTEEETAAREAQKLQDLESKRLRRMQGDLESSDESEEDEQHIGDEDEYQDDAEAFGLSQTRVENGLPELEVEDEDEFVLDDDLIASDAENDLISEEDSDEQSESGDDDEDDGNDDLINGVVIPGASKADTRLTKSNTSSSQRLAYTYPCPQSHKELLSILQNQKVEDTATIIQRIRALHHASISPDNKAKLATFAGVLVEHLAYMGNKKDTPMQVVENLIRHIHSMAKSNPEAVGHAFRSQLQQISENRPLAMVAGDLILLTAISTIFPTSDHFHPVVTPAMLTIARYLGQNNMVSVQDVQIGLYCCTLALQCQQISKRFVPEVIPYLCNALAVLCPMPLSHHLTSAADWIIPARASAPSLHIHKLGIESKPGQSMHPLAFRDLFEANDSDEHKTRLALNAFSLLTVSSELWKNKSAISEVLQNCLDIVAHWRLNSFDPPISNPIHKAIAAASVKITSIAEKCRRERKPLLLHDHRPLAIKTSVPKFEEFYNPDKHYDPDRDRSSLNKLKAEHRREHKGALRELRKDANFVAREQLREKKERDDEYEKKYKRLVADVQGEEGREGKEYEREKRKRKGGRM